MARAATKKSKNWTVTGTGNSTKNKNKGVFGIILPWPELKNAEYEVVMRFAATARDGGYHMLVLDREGYPVVPGVDTDMRAKKRIDFNSLDFVISLHFQSPRIYDCFTYSALWNPIQFYFDFGYSGSILGILSHNDFLSCGSEPADSHVKGLLSSTNREAGEFGRLYHSLSTPIYPPRELSKPKIFYCGINWERINNSKGRHHELLKTLDKSGNLKIFGPEKFMGTEPWEGYKSYSGSIPFDGSSLVSEIASCGVGLVLSSASHQASEIMSNRLFECLAAGAVVIADHHPFLRRYFEGLYLKIGGDDEEILAQVMRHMRWIESNPEEARQLAERAQQRFLEEFTLDKSLAKVFDDHPGKVAAYEQRHYAQDRETDVDVVVPFPCFSLDLWRNVVNALKIQTGVRLRAVILMDERVYFQNERAITQDLEEIGHECELRLLNWFEVDSDLMQSPRRVLKTGEALLAVWEQLNSPYFTILYPNESWFHDHLTTLVRTFEDDPDLLISTSGQIIEDLDGLGKPTRNLVELATSNFDPYFYANQIGFYGRCLYSRKLLDMVPQVALRTIDLAENNLFNLHGFINSRVGQTHFATFVYMTHYDHVMPKPMLPLEHQHQIIRDTAAYNPAWMQRRFEREGARHLTFSTNTGAVIRPNSIRPPGKDAETYALGERVNFGKGGRGVLYQQLGFSSPETEFVWIEGTVGELVFDLNEDVAGDLELSLTCGSGPNARVTPQRVLVVLNGVRIGFGLAAAEKEKMSFIVPREVFEQGRKGLLRLIMQDGFRPNQNNPESGDDRLLSLRLYELQLVKIESETVRDPATGAVISQRQFDEDAYLAEYSDVAQSVRTGLMASGWAHFSQHGIHEGRQGFWK